jgi:toluene monooxygenase system protein B
MTEIQDTGMQAEEIATPADEGQPVPINAMFEDDFVTQLVLVLDTDTVDQAAGKVAAQVVGRRVPPRDAGLVVRVDGKVVPGDLTVAQAGIAPLDIVDVGWGDPK